METDQEEKHAMLKKIDFHQHIVLDPRLQLVIMDRYGIEKAIVMPLEFGDFTWQDALSESGINKKSRDYPDEQSIRSFIATIEQADITITDKENIFYNNARKLLGL